MMIESDLILLKTQKSNLNKLIGETTRGQVMTEGIFALQEIEGFQNMPIMKPFTPVISPHSTKHSMLGYGTDWKCKLGNGANGTEPFM